MKEKEREKKKGKKGGRVLLQKKKNPSRPREAGLPTSTSQVWIIILIFIMRYGLVGFDGLWRRKFVDSEFFFVFFVVFGAFSVVFFFHFVFLL